MPVSAQTASRFGPIHCGQSSAATLGASDRVTVRIAAAVIRCMAVSPVVWQCLLHPRCRPHREYIEWPGSNENEPGTRVPGSSDRQVGQLLLLLGGLAQLGDGL